MTSPILLIAGRFLLASALLMALYWVVWRKQATYRAKRMYLLTMPIVALVISLLQVEVYKPEPIIVEVSSNEIQATRGSLSYDSLPNLLPREGVNSAEPLTASSEAKTMHTESATYAAGSDTSLPSHEEDTEWGLTLTGIAYTLIILALFTPFAFSLYQVRRLRREVSVRKDDNEHDIHVLMGSVVKAPFSFYRTIFMPLALTEAQRRMIMEHERAHILHRHYIDVWVSETVTRLLWWNPFLWWARAELRNVHEFEADSEVLATGEDVLAYQTILIEEVLHGDVIIANGFNHSFIRRRFVEMLQSTNRRMTSMAKAGTAAWMLLVIALMCCTVGEAETVYKVKSDELQVTIDGAFNTGEKVVRFNHRYVVEKDLGKRDSLMWAHAYSIPADFNISIGMKSKEEQKLFERFMMIWSIIVDYNGQLERGEYPIGPDSMEMSEEEKRNGLLKSKELYREMLMQRLSQIDTPLRDTLNQFLEKFGLDFVLPKGKGFRVRYKNHKGEPAFFTRPEQKAMTGMQTAIVNNIREAALKPGEVVDVPMTTFEESFDTTFTVTVEAPWTEEVVIDNSFEAQNEALMHFIAEWFELSENAVHLSESGFDEKYKDFKDFTYEDYNKGWNGTIILQINFMSKWLNKLNSELRPQVEALLKQHGWIIPRDKEFIITIESKAFNKTWRLKKEPKESGVIHFFTAKETEEINRIAKIANEPAITNDASLREQDEALQAFFRGWFDMNKSSQEPMLTEEEFQQAIKTEPIPPGFDPSYKAYKERTKNFIAEAKKKMEEGRARLNKEIRPQVEAVLKQHGMKFPPERQLKIIIRAAYKNATWEFENTTHPNAYGCAVNKNFLIVDDPSSPDYNEKKDFISPQWGLELPEGYVRLTDYKKLAETDATAKAQYNQLMSCFRNAQALRKEALTNAYKEKHPRYVSVEEATMAGIKKLFRNAGIEMLEKGAYRLPDGTIVMEDDQHNLVPQSVDYQQGTTDRDPRLCNKAPRMERDKSPNYSPFNEQTWPVYTNVQTIDLETYNNQPQVFRGKDCTYVVEHFPITYDLHWFYTSTQDKLVDTKTGDQYMKRYTEHLHMNNYMWIHGMEGKVIRLISIYPPLPKNVTSVDFIPSRIPDEIRLSNAAPLKEYKKLKVQELEQMEKVVY